MYGRLLRFRLRRDRVQLLVWGLVLFLMTYTVGTEVRTSWGTAAERASMVKVMTVTPAILLFRGTPQGTSEGDLMALLGMSFIALLVMFQLVFLVTRHTRAEEQTGQTETIASTVAGRLAPSYAVLTLALIATVIAWVAITLGCLANGLPAGGSALFGAGAAFAGLSFAGVTFLLAQLFPASRTVNGWAVTLAVVSYFVRGIGDAGSTIHTENLTATPLWITWLSPIGWAQATRPWALNRVWPLALGTLLFAVCTVVALAIQDRRDVGAGVMAERKGRPAAPGSLLGTVGLALRLERGSLIAWIIAVIATAMLMGSLAGSVVDQLASAGGGAAAMIEHFGGGGPIVMAFVNIGAVFSGMLASAICVQGAIRLRQEEIAQGADAVLSTAASRAKWMLSFLLVAAVGSIVSLVLGGLVAGVLSTSASGGFHTWFWAIVWQIPAVLMFLGVVAVVFAVLPRATAGVGWAVFGLSILFGMFGPLLGMPAWTSKLTPFMHVPAIALPHPQFTGGWVMVGISVVLVAASVLLFRLRDTKPGA
ncbi:MAG: hypothetical protein FWD85_05715 [Microbacteriaceae bacterium]|nr:hypothetical protein [Microbacteriaceae bacterium]MCL2794787.1 hypothetical protein [Microbacteriaceae bacterium]